MGDAANLRQVAQLFRLENSAHNPGGHSRLVIAAKIHLPAEISRRIGLTRLVSRNKNVAANLIQILCTHGPFLESGRLFGCWESR